jgi:hypothetical protein
VIDNFAGGADTIVIDDVVAVISTADDPELEPVDFIFVCAFAALVGYLGKSGMLVDVIVPPETLILIGKFHQLCQYLTCKSKLHVVCRSNLTI